MRTTSTHIASVVASLALLAGFACWAATVRQTSYDTMRQAPLASGEAAYVSEGGSASMYIGSSYGPLRVSDPAALRGSRLVPIPPGAFSVEPGDNCKTRNLGWGPVADGSYEPFQLTVRSLGAGDIVSVRWRARFSGSDHDDDSVVSVQTVYNGPVATLTVQPSTRDHEVTIYAIQPMVRPAGDVDAVNDLTATRFRLKDPLGEFEFAGLRSWILDQASLRRGLTDMAVYGNVTGLHVGQDDTGLSAILYPEPPGENELLAWRTRVPVDVFGTIRVYCDSTRLWYMTTDIGNSAGDQDETLSDPEADYDVSDLRPPWGTTVGAYGWYWFSIDTITVTGDTGDRLATTGGVHAVAAAAADAAASRATNDLAETISTQMSGLESRMQTDLGNASRELGGRIEDLSGRLGSATNETLSAARVYSDGRLRAEREAISSGFTGWTVELVPPAGGTMPSNAPPAELLTVDQVAGYSTPVWSVFRVDNPSRSQGAALAQLIASSVYITNLSWSSEATRFGAAVRAVRHAVPTVSDIDRRWTQLTNYNAWLEDISLAANQRARNLESWQYTNSVTRSDMEAGMTAWAVTPTWPVGRVVVAKVDAGGTDRGKWSLFRPDAAEHSAAAALVPPQAGEADITSLEWPGVDWSYTWQGVSYTTNIDITASRVKLATPADVRATRVYADGRLRAEREAISSGFTGWTVELMPDAGGQLPPGIPPAELLTVDQVAGYSTPVWSVFRVDNPSRSQGAALAQLLSSSAYITNLIWSADSTKFGAAVRAVRRPVPTVSDIDRRWTQLTNYNARLENIALTANKRARNLESWQYTNSVTRSDMEAGMTAWAVTPTWPVGRVVVARVDAGDVDVGKWSLFRTNAVEHSADTALVTPQAADADAILLEWPGVDWSYTWKGVSYPTNIDIVARRTRLVTPADVDSLRGDMDSAVSGMPGAAYVYATNRLAAGESDLRVGGDMTVSGTLTVGGTDMSTMPEVVYTYTTNRMANTGKTEIKIGLAVLKDTSFAAGSFASWSTQARFSRLATFNGKVELNDPLGWHSITNLRTNEDLPAFVGRVAGEAVPSGVVTTNAEGAVSGSITVDGLSVNGTLSVGGGLESGPAVVHGGLSVVEGGLTVGGSDVMTELASKASASDLAAVSDAVGAMTNDSRVALGTQVRATNNGVAVGNISTNTGSNATAVGGSASAGWGAVAVGYNSQSPNNTAVAVGNSAKARAVNAMGLGYMADASVSNAVAVGYKASASATNAVQLGEGTNSAIGTLQFRDYQLVDADGYIPTNRLTNVAATLDFSQLSAEQLDTLRALLGVTDDTMYGVDSCVTVPIMLNDYGPDEGGGSASSSALGGRASAKAASDSGPRYTGVVMKSSKRNWEDGSADQSFYVDSNLQALGGGTGPMQFYTPGGNGGNPRSLQAMTQASWVSGPGTVVGVMRPAFLDDLSVVHDFDNQSFVYLRTYEGGVETDDSGNPVWRSTSAAFHRHHPDWTYLGDAVGPGYTYKEDNVVYRLHTGSGTHDVRFEDLPPYLQDRIQGLSADVVYAERPPRGGVYAKDLPLWLVEKLNLQPGQAAVCLERLPDGTTRYYVTEDPKAKRAAEEVARCLAKMEESRHVLVHPVHLPGTPNWVRDLMRHNGTPLLMYGADGEAQNRNEWAKQNGYSYRLDYEDPSTKHFTGGLDLTLAEYQERIGKPVSILAVSDAFTALDVDNPASPVEASSLRQPKPPARRKQQ